MSGIYIPNMEMPTTCKDCPCFYPEYNERNAIVGRWVDGKGTPPSDCPLVPAPPHGRLIDGDKLAEEQKENVRAYHANLITLDDLAECLLKQSISEDGAPTIIQAEPFNDLSKHFKKEGET